MKWTIVKNYFMSSSQGKDIENNYLVFEYLKFLKTLTYILVELFFGLSLLMRGITALGESAINTAVYPLARYTHRSIY